MLRSTERMNKVPAWKITPYCLCAVAVVLLAQVQYVQAQIAGEPVTTSDTIIVFEPALPLLTTDAEAAAAITQGAGLDVLFSGSGWGFGGFYQHKIVENITAFGNFGFSGRRNTDEFENAWLGNVPVVTQKVNRLYMLPVTIGFQYRLMSESLQESFRPFVAAGVTPTVIFQTPYIQDGVYYEFFQSWGYAQTHFRWGGMLGVGSMFGKPSDKSVIGVMIRYYTIPFGGNGLESIRDFPISNFGGVFLSLSVGGAW